MEYDAGDTVARKGIGLTWRYYRRRDCSHFEVG